MFINKNKPEKSGRLVALLMNVIAAKPNAPPPNDGHTSEMNGLIRSGSSVKISKAFLTIFYKTYLREENEKTEEMRKCFASRTRGK